MIEKRDYDMQENKTLLVVGLGNPGTEYERTRHNVGFMAIKYLCGENVNWKKERNALTCIQNIDGNRIMFVMPQTYMNNSGIAVGALMAFYKIPLENLVVIHDDLDLPVGVMKSKIGGGSAGHNGIKSIDGAVGNNYKRIRIGIGHPRDLGLPMSPADWVLGRFSNEDLQKIIQTISEIKIL